MVNKALVFANTGDKRVDEIHSHVASSQSLEHACVSYGTCLFVSPKLVAARSLWHQALVTCKHRFINLLVLNFIHFVDFLPFTSKGNFPLIFLIKTLVKDRTSQRK